MKKRIQNYTTIKKCGIYIDHDATISNNYYEDGDKKYAWFNEETSGINANLTRTNILYSSNLWELFKCALNTRIETEEIKGKECYCLTNIPSWVGGYRYSYGIVCVEKETGFVTKTAQIDSFSTPIETIFEYNTVTEEEFIEPDVSEYKIVNSLEDTF